MKSSTLHCQLLFNSKYSSQSQKQRGPNYISTRQIATAIFVQVYNYIYCMSEIGETYLCDDIQTSELSINIMNITT